MKLPPMRIEPKEQKQNLADLILEQRDKITALQSEIDEARGEAAELLTVCQSIHRDLLLRAEPDWDGSGRKVVNLSAGFWDELNRVIGKSCDLAGRSFDAMVLRKQAEAIEKVALRFPETPFVDCDNVRADIMGDAEILRRQADEVERAGGES